MIALTFQGLSGWSLGGLYLGLALAMVLLYLLKLKRRQVAIPFSPLWATVISERQSSALFRRLKRLWSLLLQLFLLALVVGALGDPKPERASGCGFAPPEPPPVKHTLLLIDTSSSMNAMSGGLTRFDAAIEAAERVLESGGDNPEHRFMIAAADVRVRPMTLWTVEPQILKEALATLKASGPRSTPTDVARTLEVARQVLRDRVGAEALWITDRAFEAVPPAEELALQVIEVGEPGANLGIEGFNVRPALDDGLSYAIFLAIRNTSERPLKANVHLYANDEGVEVADFVQESRIVTTLALSVPPGEVLRHVLSDVSFEGSRLAARVAIDPSEPVGDIFEGDDVAFALVPERTRLKVQLVSPGNLFLQASLFLRENVDLSVVAPEDYAGPAGYDVTFIDGVDVDLSAPGRYVLLNPPDGQGFEHKGVVKTPAVRRVKTRHPLVRGLTFADAGILEATRFSKAKGDETIVEGTKKTPLIFTRHDIQGERTFVVFAFDLRRSLLPVSYAFPLLVVNALNWYQPQPDGLLPTHRAGVPLSLVSSLGDGEPRVKGPAEVALRRLSGRLHFTAPEIGIYDFELNADERFSVAVNLMDARESEVTPRAEYPVWTAAEPYRAPSPPWPGTPWRAFLLIAVALLTIEWWTWHRRLTL